MQIYTIGFTQKTAQNFFSLIKSAEVKTVFDVRLNNVSQLAGFAKKNDLSYFLAELCNTEYLHLPELAPTAQLLNAYKRKEISWEIYAERFNNLMSQRHVEKLIQPALLKHGCFLCSEHEPHFCHRRLVAEYLNERKGLSLDIIHLK